MTLKRVCDFNGLEFKTLGINYHLSPLIFLPELDPLASSQTEPLLGKECFDK